jgi:hypothetical protein
MVKGETVMPVPEGIISTSTGPAESVQEVTLEEAILEADVEEAIPFERINTDDLPELS